MGLAEAASHRGGKQARRNTGGKRDLERNREENNFIIVKKGDSGPTDR